MYPLDRPVMTAPPLPAPLPAVPVLSVDGPGQAFPELLAALAAPLEPALPLAELTEDAPQPEPGNELPGLADPTGNELPLALTSPLAPIALLPLPQAPSAPVSADVQAAAEAAPPLPKAAVHAPDLEPAQEQQTAAPQRHKPDSAAILAELSALPQRGGEAVTAIGPVVPQVREAPSAPSVSGTLATPAGAQPTPGSQLEQLVEVLMQAREAGKGARSDLMVRHAEFGMVAIRLEQADGETRAHISGRDPGFAPAVVAALAERSGTGFSEQHQRGQDQTWGQTGGQPAGTHSDARQQDRHPERRGAPISVRPQPALQHSGTDPDDEPPNQSRGERHGRFA